MTWRAVLVLLLTPLAAGLAGCSAWPFARADSRGELAVWAAGEMTELTQSLPRTDEPKVYEPATRTVSLFGACNETVSFQLVVDAGSAGAKGVRIAAGDLVGPNRSTIARGHIRMFRMLPVKVESYPAWYLRLVPQVPQPTVFYDALAPLDAPKSGQPFDLAPNERLAVWVDVAIPRTSAAGEFRCTLQVASQTHRDFIAQIALKVYDFVLPDSRPMAAIGGFDHRTLFRTFIQRDGKPFEPAAMDRANPLVRDGLVIMRQLMTLAHEHRLDLVDRSLRPVLKRDMLGKVRLDWDDYDAIVAPYLSGSAFDDGIGVPAWPLPVSDEWPDPAHYGSAASDDYAATLAAVTAESRDHLSRQLQFGRQVFCWPYRGPIEQGGYESFMRLARICRSADSETPILAQLPPRMPELTGWRVPEGFAACADIIAPPAHWLSPAPTSAPAASPAHPLAGAWLAPGQSPYLPSLGVIAKPSDVRAIAWFAMKYRCAGLLLPEVLNWEGDLFRTAAGAETRLFYPGRDFGLQQVLPSVRLKRLRRGLQDAAYLHLLQQRQLGAVSDGVMASMARYACLDAVGDNYLDPRLDGWMSDGATWELARRLLAEEVLVAVRPSEASNADLLAQRVTWKSFQTMTRAVQVEQVRCRVERVADSRRLRSVVMMDLYNQLSIPADVTVRLGDLPQGWKLVDGEATLSPMAPATRRTVTLTAEGEYVPATQSARMPLTATITTDLGSQRTISCEVPFIISPAVRTGPKIDGMLDDWPMQDGGAAADFRLIGRRGQVGDGLAARQTLALVCHDEKNLYVAFRCEEPELAKVVAQPNNLIRYEQLMACGEDLVEVVLDPGASASGPADLFHIAVKANGVVLAERGVQTDPPLGAAEPWPVAARVAVGRLAKVWTVEMEIPLVAFGQRGQSMLWGVNVTRFATQGCEASSWSGAPRYFYDPRNLGTMFLVPAGQ